MTQKLIFNKKELDILASNILKNLNFPNIILLKGNLGAGKTSLSKSIIKYFGYDFKGSPTFNLLNTYTANKISICHLDLYRINEQDINSNDFDFLSQSMDYDLIIVEWFEKVPFFEKFDHITIEIRKSSERTRTYNIIK